MNSPKPDMYDIRDVVVSDPVDAKYVIPRRVTYLQGGRPKFWEVVETYDSVAILLYHRIRKAFILVKQFRPSVYLTNQNGFTYELCAGLCDKAIDVHDVAREEILEETGYHVPVENIERITSFYTAVGFAGGKQNLFYAEVDDSMRANEGGGIDEEMIEVVYLPIDEGLAFIMDESRAKTPGLMFAFQWFLQHRQ